MVQLYEGSALCIFGLLRPPFSHCKFLKVTNNIWARQRRALKLWQLVRIATATLEQGPSNRNGKVYFNSEKKKTCFVVGNTLYNAAKIAVILT